MNEVKSINLIFFFLICFLQYIYSQFDNIRPTPISSNEWVNVDQSKVINIIEKFQAQINIDNHVNPVTKKFIVRKKYLPFYKNGSLIEILDTANQKVKLYNIVATNSDTILLKGKSDVIHSLNKRNTVVLNSSKLIKYAEFFINSLHTETGKFVFVNNNELVKDFILEMDDQSLLEDLNFNPRIIQESDSSVTIKCHIFYGNNLFESEVIIEKDRTVKMSNDKLISSNIVLRQESFLNGGIEILNDSIVDLFYRANKYNDPTAQINIGYKYHYAKGLPKNNEKCFYWWQKAASQGDRIGQFNLATCYTLGIGVKINKSIALSYLQKSAEQGFHRAQYSLGMKYLNGFGVEINKEKAMNWLKKSAEQGNIDAVSALEKYVNISEGQHKLNELQVSNITGSKTLLTNIPEAEKNILMIFVSDDSESLDAINDINTFASEWSEKFNLDIIFIVCYKDLYPKNIINSWRESLIDGNESKIIFAKTESVMKAINNNRIPLTYIYDKKGNFIHGISGWSVTQPFKFETTFKQNFKN